MNETAQALIIGGAISNFYSSGREAKRWVRLVDEIKKWVDLLFPSSNPGSCLITAGGKQTLPNGEIYTHVAASGLMITENEKLIRGISFVFASGLRREDLCNVKFTMFFNDQGRIEHLVIATHSPGVAPKHWSEQLQNLFSDVALTPAQEFAAGLRELREAIKPVIGKTGDFIRQDHPLINRRPQSRTVWLPPDEGGSHHSR